MADKPKFTLSDSDLLALQQAVYGEGAGSTSEVRKMIGQSAINRLRSGRGKEFGKTMQEVLNKPGAYYAVSNPNEPYKQAVSGKFPDNSSKARWGETKKEMEILVDSQDFGKHLFYHTDDEVEGTKKANIERAKQKKPPKFDYTKVKPAGRVDKYNLYSY